MSTFDRVIRGTLSVGMMAWSIVRFPAALAEIQHNVDSDKKAIVCLLSTVAGLLARSTGRQA